MAKDPDQSTLPTHGAAVLPSVEVDSYNLEVEDDDGFVGDKASRGAFREMLDKWRQPLRELGEDPFDDKPSEEISKKKLDSVLAQGTPEAAGVVQSAVEEFAQQLAKVIRRFLRQKTWRDTDSIVIGGGFRASRVGELAIARTELILKAEEIPIDIELIRHDPDEAGLLGAAHLLPAWMLAGYEGILAVDVGGTNIRAGVVKLNQGKAKDLSQAVVLKSELWRHGDEDVKRDDAVDRLVEMLEAHVKDAKKTGFKLAPLIGIGCPGVIDTDGAIERGAQNLPGNWESNRFNLPRYIRDEIPEHRRARDHRGDAQRCRRAGPEPAALHAGPQALGRADHRHGARQRAVHQPRQEGQGLRPGRRAIARVELGRSRPVEAVLDRLLEHGGSDRVGEALGHDPHHVVLGIDAARAGEAAGVGAAVGVAEDRLRAAPVVLEDVEVDRLQVARHLRELDVAEDAAERVAAGACAVAHGVAEAERLAPVQEGGGAVGAGADVAAVGRRAEQRIGGPWAPAADAVGAGLEHQQHGDALLVRVLRRLDRLGRCRGRRRWQPGGGFLDPGRGCRERRGRGGGGRRWRSRRIAATTGGAGSLDCAEGVATGAAGIAGAASVRSGAGSGLSTVATCGGGAAATEPLSCGSVDPLSFSFCPWAARSCAARRASRIWRTRLSFSASALVSSSRRWASCASSTSLLRACSVCSASSASALARSLPASSISRRASSASRVCSSAPRISSTSRRARASISASSALRSSTARRLVSSAIAALRCASALRWASFLRASSAARFLASAALRSASFFFLASAALASALRLLVGLGLLLVLRLGRRGLLAGPLGGASELLGHLVGGVVGGCRLGDQEAKGNERNDPARDGRCRHCFLPHVPPAGAQGARRLGANLFTICGGKRELG